MRINIVPGILGIAAALFLAFSGCSKDKAAEAVTGPSGTPVNHAPIAPKIPIPADNATGQNASVLYLQWHCYDQDSGDTLSYTVRMGPGSYTDSATGVATETLMLVSLSANTNYIWQVTARDNHGASSAGPVWHFKTQ